MAMDDAERDAWLMLTLASGWSPVVTRRCVETLGSARAAVVAGVDELTRVEGVGTKKAQTLRAALDELSDGKALARELELLEKVDARLVAMGDDDYPALLRHIHDPPPVLYVRGTLSEADGLGLAIVGSRQCTHYGREQADRFSAFCAQAGMTIVSGGAYGIDAAAHRAALRVRGRTVAVLGSGLAKPYPPEHVELYDQIAAGGGAVVSELPMSAPPMRENFPARNRIISGWSLGVLVIEAASASGALITARVAAEDHQREVMALPGRVDSSASAGCHELLRKGSAALVTTPAEVLDSLGEAGRALQEAVRTESAPGAAGGLFADGAQEAGAIRERNLSDSQKKIMEALTESMTIDQIAARTGLTMATLQADLTMLQIRGLVNRAGPRYERRGA